MASTENLERAAEAAPDTFPEVVSTLSNSLLSVWGDFVAHLPLIGISILVIALTWLASLATRWASRALLGRKARRSLVQLVERLLTMTVWILGLLLAAMVVFPGLSPAKALGGLGLLSVAVGFAFKDIFQNFFAGILMLWKYPFESGDFIESGDIVGKVEEITVRMTQIRKTSGELVLVPNSMLFQNPTQVLTDRSSRRVTVMTGVAYGEDLASAIDVIESAVKDCGTVHADEPIQVFAQGFGESSMDIEVTWWCDPTPLGLRRSRHEVVVAVKTALDKAGIEIPFPYRTLTFKEPLAVHGLPVPADSSAMAGPEVHGDAQ